MFNPEMKVPHEEIKSPLEEKRFLISKETEKYLNDARRQLKEWQEIDPAVLGMAFLGSRLVKNEKPHSDLDTIVFYNGDKVKFKFSIFTKKKRIERSFGNLNSKDENTKDIPYGLIEATNLSGKAIKDYLDQYSRQLKNGEFSIKDAAEKDFVWRIISPFFLSIGRGVYEAREKIFTELKTRPDGDLIWQSMVTMLSFVERDGATQKRQPLPSYDYPQNLQEAEQYFINLPES